MGLNDPFTHEPPIISAGAIITDSMSRTHTGNLLLVRQPHKGYPDLPGGIVEYGETPIECLLRELGEELGMLAPHIRQARLVHVDNVIKETAECTYLAFVFHVMLTVPLERYVGKFEAYESFITEWSDLPIHVAHDAPILFRRIDIAWRTVRYGLTPSMSRNGELIEV